MTRCTTSKAHDTIDADLTADIRRSVIRLGSTACTKKRGCNFDACTSTDPNEKLGCDRNRITVFAPVKTGFRVVYTVTDRNNNPVTTTREMRIRDTIKPTQFLRGSTREPLEGATEWNDPGYYAEDLLDDDDTLSAKIRVRCVNCQELADLGISRAGDQIDSNARAFTVYRLEYTVTDDGGNVADKIYRDVEVRDSIPPLIEARPKVDALNAATVYAEPAVIAEDTLDGKYPFLPRFTSRIRSRVRRADRLCDYSYQYFDETKLRDRGLFGKCTTIAAACTFPSEYEEQSPTKTLNRVCVPVSTECLDGPELVAPTLTSDRVCHKCEGRETPLLASPVKKVQKEGQLRIQTHTIPWNLHATVSKQIVTLKGSTVQWTWSDSNLPLDLVPGTRPPAVGLSSSSSSDGASGGGGDGDAVGKASSGLFVGVSAARDKNSTLPVYSLRFLRVGVFPFYSTAYPLLDGSIVVQSVGQTSHQASWGGITGLQHFVVAAGDSLTWLWDRRRPSLSLIERTFVTIVDERTVTLSRAAGGLQGTCNPGDAVAISVQIDTRGEQLQRASIKIKFDPTIVEYGSAKHTVSIVTGGGAAVETKFDVDTSFVVAGLTLPTGAYVTGTASQPVNILEFSFVCKVAGALETLPVVEQVETTEIRKETLTTQSSGIYTKLFEDEGSFAFESEDGDDMLVTVTTAENYAASVEETSNRLNEPILDAPVKASVILTPLRSKGGAGLKRNNDGLCHEISVHDLEVSLRNRNDYDNTFDTTTTSTTTATTVTVETATTSSGRTVTTTTATSPPVAYPAIVLYDTLEAQQTEALSAIISDLEELISGVESVIVRTTSTTTLTSTTTTVSSTTTTTTNNATTAAAVTTSTSPSTTTTPPRPEVVETDEILERVRWLDVQDTSLDAMILLLKAELLSAEKDLAAVRDGGHRVEYSEDGGRSWHGLSARPDVLPSSKAVVFRVPSIASGYGGKGFGSSINTTGSGSSKDPRMSVRLRLIPSRIISGTRVPLFKYRLWNDPTPALSISKSNNVTVARNDNDQRPTVEFINLVDVRTVAQAEVLADAGAGTTAAKSTWDVVSAIAVMEVETQLSIVAVDEGDNLDEITPTFEIEEDEQYANFPYKLVRDLLRDSLGEIVDAETKLEGVGLAIVEVSPAGDGIWTYTCGDLSSATFLPIPLHVSASSALVLQGGCRIRFEPGQDYNSEVNLDGNPRLEDDVNPHIKVKVWNPFVVEDLETRFAASSKCSTQLAIAAGIVVDSGVCYSKRKSKSAFWIQVDTTAPQVPGEFGFAVHTMSTNIVAAEDNPIFLPASSRRGVPVDIYTTTFPEGSGPIPVVDLEQTDVTLIDPDGSELSSISVRIQNASRYDSLIWPVYEFERLGVRMSDKKFYEVVDGETTDFGAHIYTISPVLPLTKLPTATFNAAVRLVMYQNTATNPAGDTRTIQFGATAVPRPGEVPRRTEAEDPTSGFTVVKLDKFNSRPFISLHPVGSPEKKSKNGVDYVSFGPKTDNMRVLESGKITDDNAQISKLTVRAFGRKSLVGEEVVSFSSSTMLAANESGISFKTLEGGKLVEATGMAPAATWSLLLGGLQYRHSKPVLQRSARSIEIVAFDDTNRASIPTRLLVLMYNGEIGAPFVDLNGDEEDGGDILESAQRVFVEQSAGLLLADKLVVYPVGTTFMTSARIVVERARDFPFEIVKCDQAKVDQAGLEMFVDPGAAAVVIRGEKRYDEYQEVLRTCTYENNADEPYTKVNRLVDFTITSINTKNDNEYESPSSHVVVRVVSVNDAPTIHRAANPSAFFVPQGVEVDKLAGISVADLLGDTPARYNNSIAVTAPVFREKMKLLPCRGPLGCRWADANVQCTRFGLKLCTREDANELWPHNSVFDIDGAGGAADGGVSLAWTADQVQSDPLAGAGDKLMRDSTAGYNITFCGHATDANSDLHDVGEVTGGCNIDYGEDSTSAFLMHGRPGGVAPNFFLARQSSQNAGRPIDALCCPRKESTDGSDKYVSSAVGGAADEGNPTADGGNDAKEAIVWIESAGISGSVVFSQATPASAMHVAITLNGMADIVTKRQPRVGHMQIHDFPTSFLTNGSCANGPVLGASSDVCKSDDLCATGIVSDMKTACCPRECLSCDLDSCALFPDSSSGCCPETIVDGGGNFCVEPSDTGCKVMQNGDQACIAGKLSERHGALNASTTTGSGATAGGVNRYVHSYIDTHLTLHGDQSLISRSLVLYNLDSSPIACGTIGDVHVQTLVAPMFSSKTSEKVGTIEVSQSRQRDGSGLAVIRAIVAKDGTTTDGGVFRWGLQVPDASSWKQCNFEKDGFDVNLDEIAGLLVQSSTRNTLLTFALPKASFSDWSRVAVAVVPQDVAAPQKVRCDLLGGARRAIATINMKGTIGTVEFSQTYPGADVHVKVSIASYKLQNSLAKSKFVIHKFPVSRPEMVGVLAADECLVDQVGDPVYEIAGIELPASAAGVPAVAEFDVPKSQLTLFHVKGFEERMIMGRSVVITTTTNELVCGSVYSVEEQTVATATFGPPLVNDDQAAGRSQLTGRVSFRQPKDDPNGPTTIVTNLQYANDEFDSGSGEKHTFVISALPSLFTCTKEAASQTLFKPDVAVKDQELDLIPGQLSYRNDLSLKTFAVDNRVALNGFNSVADLYVVVFQGFLGLSGDAEPVGCAKIDVHTPRQVSALFDYAAGGDNAVHGKVVLTQVSPNEPTQVDVRFDSGLPADVSSWQVTRAGATSTVNTAGERVWECSSGLSLRDVTFNPRSSGLEGTLLVPAATECNGDIGFEQSVDDCKLGDLQGILGSIGGGNVAVHRSYMHPNLPLFGPYSVEGHGLLLSFKGADGNVKPLACSPLLMRAKKFIVAEATFSIPEDESIYNGALFGTIAVKQPVGDLKAPSTIQVNLGYECSRKDYRWQLSKELILITYGPSQTNPRQSAIPSVEECSQLCTDNANCTQWTWASPEAPADFVAKVATGDCILLKSDLGHALADNAQPGFVSGRRGCETPNVGQRALRHSWKLGASRECPGPAANDGGSAGGNNNATTAAPPTTLASSTTPTVDDDVYNPQQLDSKVENVKCTIAGRFCAVGNLVGKHGRLIIPSKGPGQMFTDMHLPIQGPASLIGHPITVSFSTVTSNINGSATTTTAEFCSTLQPQFSQTLRDSDEGDARGIAVIDVDDSSGHWEFLTGSSSSSSSSTSGNTRDRRWRRGAVDGDGEASAVTGAAKWKPLLKSELSRTRALKLGADRGTRLRFVPDEDFEGKITCAECPADRVGITCVPCPLNMTAGAVTFVGWDGKGESGLVGDATYTSARGAFSKDSKSIAVVVDHARVDSTAPDGAQFEVTFSVADNVGNSPKDQIRLITIEDKEPPTIVLRGEYELKHEAATPYADAGAVAFDNLDGDVTNRIVITELYSKFPGNGNGSTHGAENCPGAVGQRVTFPAKGFHLSTDVPSYSQYELTMEATDVAGNRKKATRIVHIVDTTPPMVYPMYSVVPLEIEQNDGQRKKRNQKRQNRRGKQMQKHRRDDHSSVPDPAVAVDFVDANHPCPLEALYSSDTVAEKLQCAWARDTLDGDLSCHVEIKVERLSLKPSADALDAGAVEYPGFRNGEVAINGTTCSEYQCNMDNTFGVDGVGTLDDIDASAPLHTRYLVTYEVYDFADNIGRSVVTVVVSDTTPPELTWTNYETIKTIPYGATFGSKERVLDVEVIDYQAGKRISLGNSLAHVIAGKELVNTVVPGDYNISYLVTDNHTNSRVYVQKRRDWGKSTRPLYILCTSTQHLVSS